jgi:hypothetical protein
MSAAQHSIVRNIEKDAAPASAAATPQLLAALDDAALWQTLSQCCPEVASLTDSVGAPGAVRGGGCCRRDHSQHPAADSAGLAVALLHQLR